MPKKELANAGEKRIRVAKSAYRSSVFGRFRAALGYLILAFIVVYLCFAATILRVVPTATNIGLIPVKNMTFPGGHVPVDGVILADLSSQQGDSVVDRLRQSVFPSNQAVLVRVKAGPYGKVNWAPTGFTTVNGKAIGVSLPNKPDFDLLDNTYIGVCLKGACTEGEAVVIPAANIYGEPTMKSRGN